MIKTTLPGDSSGLAPAGHKGLPGNLSSILVIRGKAWVCLFSEKSSNQLTGQCEPEAVHNNPGRQEFSPEKKMFD